MSSKFSFIIIPMSLEDVYNSFRDYMINKGGKIVKEQISAENLIKTLVVQRGMSFTSNGEQYIINFKFNEYEDCTYVAIEVSLSSGYGIQWLNPLKLIKKWARQVNYYGVVNLVRKGELDIFFEFKPKKLIPIEPTPKIAFKAEKIEIQTKQPAVSLQKISPSVRKVKYCTNCGTEVNESQRFCVNCGNKIRD
ncbi:MAG: zinc ribbon domain-containing protein [Promethearchaeota archaeon]|nr:MAG: zinc ribbon domain-containing protein [Candidatus Lokiarchaeota archaeon]